MKHKMDRLAKIFDDERASAFDVHFVMVGPRRSSRLKTEDWPEWARHSGRGHFLEIPDPGSRLAVQRCTADGKPSQQGWTHWQLVERIWASSKVGGDVVDAPGPPPASS